jgi:hypothetical protein
VHTLSEETRTDMNMKIVAITVGLVLGFAAVASAQSNATLDSPFQIRAATKLKKGELINITNSGARGGDICANVYAFEPDGQMLACCSCLVQSNTLKSLAVGPDVFEDRKPFPKAAVFKVLASVPVGGTCNGAAPGAITTGLGVWRGEHAFLPSTLSAGELAGLTARCGFLHVTANVCPVCRATDD